MQPLAQQTASLGAHFQAIPEPFARSAGTELSFTHWAGSLNLYSIGCLGASPERPSQVHSRTWDRDDIWGSLAVALMQINAHPDWCLQRARSVETHGSVASGSVSMDRMRARG